MYYSGLSKYDTANGTGIRVSLFVSGCTVNCAGCFNKDAQNFKYGKEFTDSVEDEIITELKKDYVKGFSLLGGDPLEKQHQSILVKLCKRIKTEVNKPIWLWTGRLYEDVKDMDIMQYVDTLVDGPFIEEQKNLNLEYRGSENQRILKINSL